MTLAPSPVWFITGCSTGLGRALAGHVLERGRRAAVTARDPRAVAALEADEPPLRLLLGEAALKVALGKLDALRRDLTGWEHLTLATEVAG